jgi:hypothetical protein
VPATAQQTNGLVAPDGIVGVLPSYPGAPAGSTVVMYTEKILDYFMVGYIATPSSQISSSNEPGGEFGSNMSIAMGPFFNTGSEPLNAGANTIYVGDNNTNAIAVVQCAAYSSSTDTLTGCTVTGSIGGTVSAGDAVPSKAFVGGPGAATALASTLGQIDEGSATDAQKLLKNNEDMSLLRVAYTTDGINFSSAGLANGGIISGADNGDVTAGGVVNCTTDSGVAGYTDINDPCTIANPPNLNAYANNDAANGTGPAAGGTDTGATGNDAVEMRWVGTGGSIVTNPDGSYGLFLSGAWENDGDSDAFNQVYYSSSTNGQTWSVPKPVISTDYSFAASATQESQLLSSHDLPLGISAYYSGRAYDPTVVQNANGTLTLVFAGDRLPKSIATVGTTVGTNISAQYTIGANDPALYRNILTATLTSATSSAVATTTATSASASSVIAGASVTYTARVTVNSPGSGIPTGTVSFSDGGTPIAGCGAVTLSDTTTDTATCTTASTLAAAHTITTVYSGDSNYATSSASTPEQVTPDLTSTSLSASPASATFGAAVTYTATVSVTAPGTIAPTGTVAFTDNGAVIAGCSAVSLSTTAPYTATCTTSPASAATHVIVAAYGGSSSDAASASGSTSVSIYPGTIDVIAVDHHRAYGKANPTLTAEVGGDPVGLLPVGVAGAPVCTTTAKTSSKPGTYPITCTVGTLTVSNEVFAFVPGILTVTGSVPTTITGTQTATIKVAKGQTVKIGPGARIDGSVKVAAGGSLNVSGGTFKHALSLSNPGAVTICHATFDAGLSVRDAKDAVKIGGSSCAGNTVKGSLSVTGAHASVHVEHNTVSSSLTVHANRDGATVIANRVHGNLEVTANRGTVTDRPNSVHGSSHLQ